MCRAIRKLMFLIFDWIQLKIHLQIKIEKKKKLMNKSYVKINAADPPIN